MVCTKVELNIACCFPRISMTCWPCDTGASALVQVTSYQRALFTIVTSVLWSSSGPAPAIYGRRQSTILAIIFSLLLILVVILLWCRVNKIIKILVKTKTNLFTFITTIM